MIYKTNPKTGNIELHVNTIGGLVPASAAEGFSPTEKLPDIIYKRDDKTGLVLPYYGSIFNPMLATSKVLTCNMNMQPAVLETASEGNTIAKNTIFVYIHKKIHVLDKKKQQNVIKSIPKESINKLKVKLEEGLSKSILGQFYNIWYHDEIFIHNIYPHIHVIIGERDLTIDALKLKVSSNILSEYRGTGQGRTLYSNIYPCYIRTNSQIYKKVYGETTFDAVTFSVLHEICHRITNNAKELFTKHMSKVKFPIGKSFGNIKVFTQNGDHDSSKAYTPNILSLMNDGQETHNAFIGKTLSELEKSGLLKLNITRYRLLSFVHGYPITNIFFKKHIKKYLFYNFTINKNTGKEEHVATGFTMEEYKSLTYQHKFMTEYSDDFNYEK